MAPYAIIVIGASLGGVETLQKLVGGLPLDIPAALFIVQHIGSFPSSLPAILGRSGSLPARHAEHLGFIEPHRIYIAPPDHHLTMSRSRTYLSRGPRVNWSRPAIDPLFRSAAEIFNSMAIGVILSGALNDGSAGLQAIRQAHGTAVVQDPRDAFMPAMPASALRFAGADHCVPVEQMPRLLNKLAYDVLSIKKQEPSDHWRTAP